MATLAEALRGYAPPTESALADPIKEHFRTLPQQLATNQQAMQNAIGGWNKTDFATGQPNPNYSPEAIQQLTQLMPNVGALTAWHGTPHKIQGAFDISKVGTGEGAQAYGHGMYFAENPAVAEGYKTVLSKDKENLAKWALDWKEKNPELAKEFIDELKQKSNNRGTSIADFADALKNSKYANNTPSETAGLYKVDIPDEHIPNMLDWDKPLNQQPKNVKEYFTKRGYTNDNWSAPSFIKNEGNPAEVSAILHEAGIPGIRYLDQASRTPGFSSLSPAQLESRIASLQTDIKSGGGNTQKMKDQLKGLQNELDSYKNMTSNFVVFDPSTVKILEENAKPVSRKELIEKQVKSLKE